VAAGTIVARIGANRSNARAWLGEHAEAIDWSYLGSPDAHIRASEVAADLFSPPTTAPTPSTTGPPSCPSYRSWSRPST